LLLWCPAVLRYHLQGVRGIAWCLRQASTEVGEPARLDPGIVALERSETLGHQIRREQLGERGGHRLDPWPGAGEGDVGVDGEPDPGDNVPLVLYLFPRQPDCLAQAQPRLDATFSFGRAVVVEDAPDPAAAYLGQRAVGEDGGILPRDVLLVVEP